MTYKHNEELRLALVMNGGVSLAVWMGGVTNEIFRLVTERHPVYQQLLDMTRTRARVDVMSGTSAGGINSAALTLAMLFNGNFSNLREVWLKTGDLDKLLRNPMAHNPGSLMQGDEFFLPQLEEAFRQLVGSEKPADPAEMPIDLRLTTTLLEGVTKNTIDDLGTPILDVDHRASFRFSHLHSKTSDFSESRAVVQKLARAARSTASFPLAFEPSLADTKKKLPLEDATGKDISGTSHYLLDGGILDNKPFRNALHAIFGMKARHSVRRVLVYINPDAGGDATQPSTPDDAKKPEGPSLARVLGASIVGIPQAQAITDQLAALREHNETVRARRDSLLSMVLSFTPNQTETLAATLFPIYRRRRVGDAFDALFTDLTNARAMAESQATLPDLGKRQRDWLRGRFTEMLEPSKGADAQENGWIPDAWPQGHNARQHATQSWSWGLFPVEFAARLILDLLRRLQKLVDVISADNEIGEPSLTQTTMASEPGWGDPDRPRKRTTLDTGGDREKQLAKLWDRIYSHIDAIADQRRQEESKWSDRAKILLPTLGSTDAQSVTQDLATAYGLVRDPARRERCGERMLDLATLLRDTLPQALDVAESAAKHANPLVQSDARNLLGICKFFGRDTRTAPAIHPQELTYRILQLEVIEYSFTDHDEFGTDAIIELAQISGNADSPLGGKRRAADKLCGLQLAHFAAFYKCSWRVNDWTYGRLDGAERLVKILLSPERLHRYYHRRKSEAILKLREIAWEGVLSEELRGVLRSHWENIEKAIESELAFLDEAQPRFPEMLKYCADAVTTRLHYGILHDELPVLRDAVIADQNKGADQIGAGQALVVNLGGGGAAIAPAAAKRQLEAGLIGAERLLSETGSDLFTRTATHTVASLQATLASSRAQLGPLGALFAAIKMPVLALYFLSGAIVRSSRTSAAILAALIAVGTGIVVIQFGFTSAGLEKEGLSRSVVTFGWTLLALGLFFPLARAPLSALVGTIAIGLALMFVTDHGLVLAVAAGVIVVAMRFGGNRIQILVGLIALAFAALWGGGKLNDFSSWVSRWLRDLLHLPQVDATSLSPWTENPILQLAVMIAVALCIALWQVSPLSRKTERRLRAALGWSSKESPLGEQKTQESPPPT